MSEIYSCPWCHFYSLDCTVWKIKADVWNITILMKFTVQVIKAVLQIISATILAKLVTCREVALTCLQIPRARKSVQVNYIDSKPGSKQPAARSRRFQNRFKALSMHPIDQYIIARPANMELFTFKGYYRGNEVVQTKNAQGKPLLVAMSSATTSLFNCKRKTSCAVHGLQLTPGEKLSTSSR